jgi:hypothetical protein
MLNLKNKTKKRYRNNAIIKKTVFRKNKRKSKGKLLKKQNKSKKNYSRKNKKIYQKGGFLNKINSFLPQDLVNFNRSLTGVPENIIKGYQGYEQNASPYPTDQPFLNETIRYKAHGPDIQMIENKSQNIVGRL